jgi:hypothetical protein
VTIDQPDKIDGMGFRPDGRFEMDIYDHLDWSDEVGHLALVQDKINNYLSFLNSGQAQELYPDRMPTAFADPCILIDFAESPPATAVAMLASYSAQLAPHGITISYEVAPT